MRHSNISVFVPHIGCPNMCSFCNQHIISGAQKAPSSEDVERICEQAVKEISDRENTEIAFFGGSFTAIPKAYMMELLETAAKFVGVGGFHGIRISTRPDCIDSEILKTLKNYGVTSIELGAQSMKNEVLEANDRGHTAEDVEKASELIREYGFELGLQMMVGLYKSAFEDEVETIKRIIELKPDTLRIYPVVVLDGTKLAELFKSGEYNPIPFDDVVTLCADMLVRCLDSGIKVIKCGLHASDGVEGDMIAGYYHPAFKELCESKIYMNLMSSYILDSNLKNCTFAVNPSCISKALGHKKSNYEYFKNHGTEIKVIGDDKIKKYQCELRR